MPAATMRQPERPRRVAQVGLLGRGEPPGVRLHWRNVGSSQNVTVSVCSAVRGSGLPCPRRTQPHSSRRRRVLPALQAHRGVGTEVGQRSERVQDHLRQPRSRPAGGERLEHARPLAWAAPHATVSSKWSPARVPASATRPPPRRPRRRPCCEVGDPPMNAAYAVVDRGRLAQVRTTRTSCAAFATAASGSAPASACWGATRNGSRPPAVAATASYIAECDPREHLRARRRPPSGEIACSATALSRRRRSRSRRRSGTSSEPERGDGSRKVPRLRQWPACVRASSSSIPQWAPDGVGHATDPRTGRRAPTVPARVAEVVAHPRRGLLPAQDSTRQ